jgi:co-chaperonin GroES (HSP10)
MIPQGSLSYIEEFEVKEAYDLIVQHLGFEPPRPAGYHLVVKIYVREEDVCKLKDDEGNDILDENGKPKYIALPSSVTTEDKYRNCTALVLAVGPDAYKGKRFENSGSWCRIGDWVIIPRNEGTQINYRGIPMQIIPDDRILAIIQDPAFATRD